MKHFTYLGFALAIAVNSFMGVWAAPGVSVNLGVVKFGREKTFDQINQNVHSKIYNIITTSSTTKGKCTTHVTVTGNGIGDVFEMPCSENGMTSTTIKGMLFYGNPEIDSLCLFSNEPSNLIVFKDNKCTKRTYTTKKKKTSSMITELKEEDCKKIASKIVYMEDQQKHFLEAMDNHVNGKDAKPSDNKGTSSQASSGANSKFMSTSTDKGADSQKPSVSHQDTGVIVTEGGAKYSKNKGQAQGQTAAAAPATGVFGASSSGSSDPDKPEYYYSSGPFKWKYQPQW